MRKRGRDLFELLELRQRGTPPRPRQSSSSGAEFATRAKAWFEGAVASVRSRRPGQSKRKGKAKTKPRQQKKKADSAPPGTLPISGMWLAVMLLVALGAGFMLGRGTQLAAWSGGQETLRTSAPTPQPQQPGLLAELTSRRGSTDIGLQDDVETLSPYFYVVLNYPKSKGDRATQLAQHLRQNGLERARIRLFPRGTDGQPLWSVVVYVPEQAKQAERESVVDLIRNVPPPAFEPQFAPRLRQRFKLIRLE